KPAKRYWPARIARRHQRSRQARDYVAAHAHAPVYADDLCGPTGLTRRALENLFQEFLGLSMERSHRKRHLDLTRQSGLVCPAEPALTEFSLFASQSSPLKAPSPVS